jgi:hypothetical protein
MDAPTLSTQIGFIVAGKASIVTRCSSLAAGDPGRQVQVVSFPLYRMHGSFTVVLVVRSAAIVIVSVFKFLIVQLYVSMIAMITALCFLLSQSVKPPILLWSMIVFASRGIRLISTSYVLTTCFRMAPKPHKHQFWQG